ncbi:MAG TPA: DUF502 domain-containing protein [Planctomycetota bacterium]|nr:DUF502 domain-containing protein [Planctomycetota bacterium]
MKRFFLKGLFALLPIILTGAVLYFFIGFLYNNVGMPIGEALKWGVVRFTGEDPRAPTQTWAWLFHWGAPVLGFCVGIVLTLIAGFLLATYFGRKLYRWYESILKRVPLIGAIYPYARQFTDFFFGDEKKQDFKTAVAFPFPARGTYSIGFVTSQGMKALNEATGKQMVCVFVPAAPTPVSGYVVYVPREDLIPLPISVDEAMRIIISAGVIHPDHQAIGPVAPRTETGIRRAEQAKD